MAISCPGLSDAHQAARASAYRRPASVQARINSGSRGPKTNLMITLHLCLYLLFTTIAEFDMRKSALLFLLALSANAFAQMAGPALPEVEVWKSPSCGCCKGWLAHMESAGFKVKAHETEEVAAIKERFGVPVGHASCHTSRVGGYTVEGHVPADAITKLLAEKPKTAGIAVPGMPLNSPGMGRLDGTLRTVTFEGKLFSTN